MKKIHILYHNFVSKNGIIDIGGIETYIQLLAEALHRSFDLFIYFPGDEEYKIQANTYTAYSIKCSNIKSLQKIFASKYLKKEDILIFGTDQIIPQIYHEKIIGIQHGIYWDLPISIYRQRRIASLSKILKLYDNYLNILRSNNYSKLICVDHNFLNWKRTIVPKINEDNYKVILNCAADPFFKIAPTILDNKLTLLFPRRFVSLRGCIVFAKVCTQLLEKHNNFQVILSGEGPMENHMKKILAPSSRVKYTRTQFSDMPLLLESADVVVVPSLGSEGSSLSVIEGMAAGRLVVATNIGGITNLILDNYNGILCSPTYNSLFNALEKIVSNPQRFKHIPAAAQLSAKHAFSFEKWTKNWLDFLKKM